MNLVDVASRSHDTAQFAESQRTRRVMAFEMEVEGHHPGYVRNFAQAWVRHGVPGLLDFVVTPRFFDLHQDAVEAVKNLGSNSVSIRPLEAAEYDAMERISYLRYFHAWNLFCTYLERIEADHGLIMYYDFFQLPSCVGRKCPRSYSGIYFRPTFHYHTLEGFRPSLKDRIRSLRKRLLLKQVLKQSQLKRLFCLDEIAVDYMSQNLMTKTDFQHIADSFTIYESSSQRQAEHRARLGIESGRRIFCLLGVLDKRKGVRELLECLPLIPTDVARTMCVVLAGRVHIAQNEQIETLVAKLQQELEVQIVLHNKYIPDCEVQHYYDLSDVILATYQGHMGSSSALIRAALAQKPVLASDYGLMGEIVRRRNLGLTVDTTIPTAMAAGLARFATNRHDELFDAEQAAHYAQENSPTQLAQDLSVMVQ